MCATHSNEATAPTGTIPKQIFMYWDRGFDDKSAKKHGATTALQSFQLINPTWTIRALNRTQAEALTDRPNLIPDNVWSRIGKADQADIYRMILLFKYGGNWANASVTCSVRTPRLMVFLTHQPDFVCLFTIRQF